MDDFYKILGISEDADIAAVKKAYRQLVKQYHPDQNPNHTPSDLKVWHQIQDAYQTLSDPDKKAEYDSARHEPRIFKGMFTNFDQQESAFKFQERPATRDPFADFRTRSYSRVPSRSGDDVETQISIPFEKAFNGGKITLAGTRYELCPDCHGEGSLHPPSSVCPECDGTGHSNMGPGRKAICAVCHGSGEIRTVSCQTCIGIGYIKRNHRWTINIEPGLKDNSMLRLSGKGKPGYGDGPAGDLIIHVHIDKNSPFQRKGDDLEIVVDIDPILAYLGGEISVPVPEGGTVQIKVPKNSSQDKKLRIKGRGMPIRNAPRRGDLYAQLHYSWPDQMPSESKKLLLQYLKSKK